MTGGRYIPWPGVAVHMQVDHEGLRFERLGHASVRIADGTVIYIDPWSEVLTGEPGDGDIVFVTHDDPDHYDPEAVAAGLPHEGERTVAGTSVETVPAHNDPDGAHVDDEGEPWHAEGEVVGLLLTVDGTTVYFPSDTDFLPHHESVRADVFLPPVGGHYTMDRHEAADFARSVDPDLTLPVHYDTFEAVETDADAFVDDVTADGRRVELF